MSISSDDLPCQELVELVTDYLEGRLPEPERLRFEAHLGLCSGCRTYLEQMRQTVRALGRLVEEAMEPEAKQRLLAAFRDWRRGDSSTPSPT
jgi:anti-sigma factor RsiW